MPENKKSFDYFNNSGGLNLKSSPLVMPEGDTPDAVNVDHGLTGAIRKRKGMSPYSTSLDSYGWPVRGLFRLVTDDGDASIVAAVWQKLYADLAGDGDFSAIIGFGYNESYRWDGNVYKGKLYLTNGYDTPQQWDGSALEDMPATEDVWDRVGDVVVGVIVGASLPTSGGVYHNDREETFSFVVDTGGTFGTDEVIVSWSSNEDESDLLVIPADYTAGDLVDVFGGITLRFSAGDLQVADNWTVAIESTTADMWPSEWVTGAFPTHFATVNNNRAERIAAWGCPTEPSRVWMSELQVPYNFLHKTSGTAALDPWYVDVLPGDGEPVTLVSHLAGYWIVFKKTRCQVFAGDDPVANLESFGVYPVGCSAPKSLARVGTDLYFWSQHGPARAKGIQEYGDIEPLPISVKVKARVNQIRQDTDANIVAVHDNDNNRVIWYYTPSGQSGNTHALVFHYDTGGWDYYEGLAVDSAVSYFESGLGETHLLGTGDGRVARYGSGYDDLGAAYAAHYVTPWYNLDSFPIRKKVVQFLVAVDGSGYDIGVEYRWDLASDWISLGTLEDYIEVDTALWDEVSWDEFNWDHGATGIVKMHLDGSGNTIQFRFSNSDAGDAFEILGWSLLVTHHGER